MSHTCMYCGKNLSSKCYLTKHMQSCKMKDNVQLQNQQQQYEKQIQTLKEHYEQQIQSLKEQYEKENSNLKEQYEKENSNLKEQLTEFKYQIFEIAKQPKHVNTTNNNQKTLNILNQLAPYDLTAEMVQETLQKYALEKVFNEGPSGITEFVVEKILTDPDTQKPKLIATDRSRGVFKYKDSEGNLYVDNKLTKTTDILQRPLFKANDQLLLETLQRHNFDIDDFTRKIFNENSDLLNSVNKEKLSARLCKRLESDYKPTNDLAHENI
jgi:hypothetical protein